jgi:hypothetical protein
MISRSILRAGFAGLLCVAAATLGAQQTNTVGTGLTSVTLSSGFVSALKTLDVTPGVVAPTTIAGAVATFPVIGGALDLDSGLGNILHNGGLTLTAGRTVVVLQSFIIDTTGASPVLTGLVSANGKLVGRLPLFNVIAPAGASAPVMAKNGKLSLSGATLTLTAGAASTLNSVFSVSAFVPNFPIGTATVTVAVRAD